MRLFAPGLVMTVLFFGGYSRDISADIAQPRTDPGPVGVAPGTTPPLSAEQRTDALAIRNSLTLRLAHHAPVGQLKESWKTPLKKHKQFITEFHDFAPLRIAEIRNVDEWIVGSADDGDRIYVLLQNLSGEGHRLINPIVPKWRLVCFTANGIELWNKNLKGNCLQATAPVGPGVLVQDSDENNHNHGAIYVSSTGDIRLLQGEDTSPYHYEHRGLGDGMRRGNFWLWEMLGAHSGFLGRDDPGKITLVSPSKTCCSDWCEPGDFWYRRNADGTGALYEIVWQQKNCRMLRLDLATRELLVRSLYHDDGYDSRRRDPESITRRCLGVLDDCAVWVEETADGMTLHSTELRTGNDRTLGIPVARVPLSYQLTWDGKLFFYQGYGSASFRNAGTRAPDGWYFLANVRQMNAVPEPNDMGLQMLWTGHPHRIMSSGSLYVLRQDAVGAQDDVRGRQEALKAESSAIAERRTALNGRAASTAVAWTADMANIGEVASSRTPDALRSALTRAWAMRVPVPQLTDAVPFEMREEAVRWAAEVMKAEDQTVVAGGGYGDEATESVQVSKARRKRRDVFLFASQLDVPAVVALVRQAVKDPDPIVRRDAWPMLWTIGESADMQAVGECYASVPATLKNRAMVVGTPPKTQLRREQLIWQNWVRR